MKIYQTAEKMLQDVRDILLDKLQEILQEMEDSELEPEIYLSDYDAIVVWSNVDDQFSESILTVHQNGLKIDDGFDNYSVEWKDVPTEKLIQILKILENEN